MKEKSQKAQKSTRGGKGGVASLKGEQNYRYRTRTYSSLTQNEESYRLDEPVDRLGGNRTLTNCFEDNGTTTMLQI